MANTVASFYQTLVAAAAEASQVLAGTTNLMKSVYVDYQPVAATVGQTLNVAIPAAVTNQVVDQGVGDPTINDIAFTPHPIVFNKHPSYGFVIRDFEQFNSPTAIRNLLVDPALKGIAENVNASIAALVNTTNFNVNTAIATTAHIVTTAQFLSGYANLATQKVPVEDAGNMSFLQHPVVRSAILGDVNWTYATTAGSELAGEIRRTGNVKLAFAAQHLMDQQMPVTGTAPTRTFTEIYMHRWAIAMAVRPLPPPDMKVVDAIYVKWGDLPIRVSLGYSILKGGYVVVVEAGYGCAVVRPECGQIFTTAE